MTLGEINACDRDAFVQALGWSFEGSSWVAERAFARRPFATVDALHEAMSSAVAEAGPDDQLALLRAHPDLGGRMRMSGASAGEQSGAGLTQLSADDFDRLQALNTAYRRRFGFPFLYAVKGSTPVEILAALETRLERSASEEFEEALRQVYRIARFRLEGIVG